MSHSTLRAADAAASASGANLHRLTSSSMYRLRLARPHPVPSPVSCWLNTESTFGFLDMRSVQDATYALLLLAA